MTAVISIPAPVTATGDTDDWGPPIVRRIVFAMTSATLTDTAIEIAGLTFSYGDHRAVDGVDITVRRGEIYALLGTSGSSRGWA